jgi:hypothetical protein
MSKHWDSIVWIDRSEAKVFHVGATDEEKIVVHSHTSAQALHRQPHHEEGSKETIDVEFFHRIVATLDHSGGILIAGPGNIKFELKEYLDRHRPDLGARVFGVETLEHPFTAELLAVARRFFATRAHRHSEPTGPDTRRKDTPGTPESIKH